MTPLRFPWSKFDTAIWIYVAALILTFNWPDIWISLLSLAAGILLDVYLRTRTNNKDGHQ